ncbi:MAG: glycosyltransferase family 2 protein [Candidatus Saccharimonadales bacterium]
MRLAIVSICKDEEKTIKELINRIPKKIKGISLIEIIIINDGSIDKTAEIAKQVGATVYGNNTSKGLAFRFREAVTTVLRNNFDIMVNIDGDLQFAPEDIPKFVAPIVDDSADFVAADRFTDPVTGRRRRPENMPAAKYYGNKLGSWLVGRLSHQDFRDVTCGFRAYSQTALYALNTNGSHTYTQESFQMLAAKRMRIKALPVNVKYFKDRKSRVVTSIPKYVAVSAINIVRAFRDFAPLRFFMLLGAIPFVIGFGCLIFMGVYWLQTHNFSPYKFIGFSGIYLVTMGIFFWAQGLVADMQVRVMNNQEKAYEEIRRLSHRIK